MQTGTSSSVQSKSCHIWLRRPEMMLRGWCLYILISSFLFLECLTASSISLTSSVEEQGRQAACPREEVTFTCMVDDGVALEWMSDAFSGAPETFSQFVTEDVVGVSRLYGQFTTNLTQLVPDPSNTGGGDFTSTLRFNAAAEHDEVEIKCTDTRTTSLSKSLAVITMVSAPLNPMVGDFNYQQDSFTVAVEWTYPDSDPTPDVFTVLVSTSGSTTSTQTVPGNETSAALTLLYNVDYTVGVTTMLCGNTSAPATTSISEVSCGDPTHPSNGCIGDYESTAEGTEVNYQCDYGLIPGGKMVTTCLANGTWSPDPAELECVEPPHSDCGPPILSLSVSVEDFSDTVEGLVVIYSCNPGLIPEGEFRSVCRNGTGTWDPDPASTSAMCREPGTPADCGYPDPLVNGSFGGDITSTVEGSEITYQCDDGLTPEGTMAAVCGEDGEWRPNPGDVECRKNDTLSTGSNESNALSSGAVISIAVVATFVVAFTLGNISGALILYCIICTVRRKGSYLTKQEPQPPVPEYEQVSLEPGKIELRENVAYGPM